MNLPESAGNSLNIFFKNEEESRHALFFLLVV